MDRTEAKQMYAQVLQQIQAGDPMAAYSIFEQMPFPDQMAMFMTPGVGDAIAAVEAGVFNERSKENFAQGNIGSGLMDAGIGGLAAASTIPFVGKAAELGSMGVRGLRNLRSKMGDGMSGGGGGSRGGGGVNKENQFLSNIYPAEDFPDLLSANANNSLSRKINMEVDIDKQKLNNSLSRFGLDMNDMKTLDIDSPEIYNDSIEEGRDMLEQFDSLIANKKPFFRQSIEDGAGEIAIYETKGGVPVGTLLKDIYGGIEDIVFFIPHNKGFTNLNRGAVSRGQSTSRVFRNDGSVSAAEKVDGEVGRLIDQGFEGDNFMFNQDFSVPVRMQGTNRKTGEMIEIDTIPSPDGNIGMTITKLDDPMKPGSTADLEKQTMSRLTESEQTNIPKVREMIQKEKNLVAANNKEQIANRIQRELETEYATMPPATRKKLESKLRTLRKEIAELRGS